MTQLLAARSPHARHTPQYLDDLRAMPRDVVVGELEMYPKSASLSGTKLLRDLVGSGKPVGKLRRARVYSRPVGHRAHKPCDPEWHLRSPREAPAIHQYPCATCHRRDSSR